MPVAHRLKLEPRCCKDVKRRHFKTVGRQDVSVDVDGHPCSGGLVLDDLTGHDHTNAVGLDHELVEPRDPTTREPAGHDPCAEIVVESDVFREESDRIELGELAFDAVMRYRRMMLPRS